MRPKQGPHTPTEAIMKELIERIEGASGEYYPALCSDIHDIVPEPKCVQPPNYCASLDAAMSLVPERVTYIGLELCAGRHCASVDWETGECQRGASGWGKTPALALCAAALRAIGDTHDD